MKQFILNSKSAITELELYGGGKATNMARLEQTGVKVPEWFCLSNMVFSEFIKQFHHLNLWEKSHLEVEELFLGATLPREITEILKIELEKVFPSQTTYAVRSSGIGEDSKDHSFAGQFSSYLHQLSLDDILQSIKKCWASSFSERAKAYRLEKNIKIEKFGMGVIIQKMIFAEIAGVGFSRDPIHPLQRERMIISSVFGLGEGLVSGELDADHFYVSRPKQGSDNVTIESHLVKKDFKYVSSVSGGIQKIAVDEGLKGSPTLNEIQIKSIARSLVILEEKLGCPQDIEWVIENDVFYCVQTRPITNLPPSNFFEEKVKGNEFILWDNSNITESYNGVTTPLTFSHVSKAYRQVYLQYCEVMGVPQNIIKENESTFRNMLGLIRGRVYYNLGNWYKMIFLFPFAGTSKGFMETMMGVKQNLRPELAALFDFTKNPPPYSFFRNLYIFFRNLLRLLRVRGFINQFKADFDRVYSKAKKQNYDEKNIKQLLEAYDELNQELLFKWKAPIISDTRCMIFFGILKSLTEKWIKKGQSPSLYNDLLSGQGDLPSTEPTRLLMKIAKKIDEGDIQRREWFLKQPSSKIIIALKQGEQKEIGDDFLHFIDLYGFRCINELKLESTDLHEDSSFAMDAILSFVRMKNTSVDEIIKREKETHAQAERIVRENMSGVKLILFNFIVKKARSAVKDREDLRLLRTNIFGICRRIFKALGRRYSELNLISHPMDIFYLTIDELTAYQEGRSLEVDFQGLTELRKKDFQHFRKSPPPPDRFYTQGTVGLNLNYPQVIAEQDLLINEEPKSDDPSILIGTPCSPGVVEGVVRVVRESEDAEGLNGEIMVSERTDPGWVPLFPSTSGLLIERGSLLSHSAVVARELGIPTIVGIHGGLMKKLKTGMRVRMDATKGEIKILSE